MKPRCRIAWPFLVAALLSPSFVTAQAYPAKPVRVVVVTPPGLTPDVVARNVFAKVSELSNNPFPVENRIGKVGTVGAAVVAQSPPDGYTIMVANATLLSTAHVFRKLPYDPLGDFIGITPLAETVGMLVVHPSLPVKAITELIVLAKKQPGELAHGSLSGSMGHLMTALLTSMTGINTPHVPFRGTRAARNALIAGETQFLIGSIGSSLVDELKAGRVRPLGVTSAKRVKNFPDIPAISETIPGYELTSWIAAFVPAGTPKGIVDRLNAELKRALADPGVASKLAAWTVYPTHMPPEQFAERLKSDYEKYGRLIREAGVKPE